MPHNEDDYSYTSIYNADNILHDEEISFSTLETVDYAFYDFMNETMNLFAKTNKGWKKVPLIWASPERAYFAKEKKDLFDLDGTLIYPIMSIERTSIAKDLNRKGAYYGAGGNFNDPNRGARVILGRRIVADKTNNFSVAANIKEYPGIDGADPVYRTPNRQAYFPIRDKFGNLTHNKNVIYETLSIPIPVYLIMTYVVTVKTDYAQQMNNLLSPFATLGGHINSFLIKRDGFSYETFLQADFGITNSVADMGDGERVFESKLTFEVLGYVIGEFPNGDRPKVIKRQNAVKVKLPRERVILGDIPDYIDNRGFYTE